MMSSTKPGISEHSTRPTRRAAREQATGLGSMLTQEAPPVSIPEQDPPVVQTTSAPQHAPQPSTPEPTVEATPVWQPTSVAASRISASEKKIQKVPYATQIDMNTAKRVEWLIRHKGYKKTDITGDALDALLDSLAVPTADKIRG